MRTRNIITGTVLALTTTGSLVACGAHIVGTTPPVSSTIATPAASATTPPPPTPPTTTTAPSPATVYVQPPIIQTVYVTPPAPVAPALRVCAGGTYAYDSIYVGGDTSCPFALNVAADYTGPGADYAYSPVTKLNYVMNCTIVGAGTVICTGGNDAYVQF
jgi:hypothetical protein